MQSAWFSFVSASRLVAKVLLLGASAFQSQPFSAMRKTVKKDDCTRHLQLAPKFLVNS
jgi:hypothetical protein